MPGGGNKCRENRNWRALHVCSRPVRALQNRLLPQPLSGAEGGDHGTVQLSSRGLCQTQRSTAVVSEPVTGWEDFSSFFLSCDQNTQGPVS